MAKQLTVCAGLLALIAAAKPATQPSGVIATKTQPAAQTRPASAPATQPRQSFAFPFTEPTVSGNQVSFPYAYRDKLVLITFWASWCPHSRKELDFWKDAYAKYHDRGLEIIGLSLDKNGKRTIEQLEGFLTQNDMKWEQVYENSPQLSQIYQVENLPTSLLVDGTTAEILSRGQSLRRAGLARQIEARLSQIQTAPPATKPSH